MPRPSRWSASVVLAATGVALLSGCSPTVALEPAADANNPLCAEIMVRLPNAIGELERRWTNAQSTAVWANEEDLTVFLSCGVAVPAPTAELQCVSLGGVDWLVDASETPWLRMTAYGRDPATQVYVNTDPGTGGVSSNDVLTALGPVVATNPAQGACIDPSELPD